MSIALIDTSVFCNMLRVPGRDQHYQEIRSALIAQVEVSFLLPLATIFETGNHIAHIRDGRLRRTAAKRFVEEIRLALAGEAPYTPIRSDSRSDLEGWLEPFPDNAQRGIGFGDTTIIAEFERQCRFHRLRRVYIWSLDTHLQGYDRKP